MIAFSWYLLGVATPIAAVVAWAFIGCVERTFSRDDRQTFWHEVDDQ